MLNAQDDHPPFSQIRFIRFDRFVQRGDLGFPRLPDVDITTSLDVIQDETSLKNCFFIFISYRWLRPNSDPTLAFPDAPNHIQYHLCVQGINELLQRFATEFNDKSTYIWIDYGCVHQNGNPAVELQHLNFIISCCDLLFTPVVEADNFQRPRIVFNWYENCPSPNWEEYLDRSWCRLEMLFGTHIPLKSQPWKRLARFAPGLRRYLMKGTRPHVLFPTFAPWPIVLYPLEGFYYEALQPSKGLLSQESDRELIRQYETIPLRPSNSYYIGSQSLGLKAGAGIFLNRRGNKYYGFFVGDEFEGFGVFLCPDGCLECGEFIRGKLNGFGARIYLDGAWFGGYFKNGERHGKGIHCHFAGHFIRANWKYHSDLDTNLQGFDTYEVTEGYSRYIGEIDANGRHFGKGVLYSSEEIFLGNWAIEGMTGTGIWVDPVREECYIGEFYHDRRAGRGTLFVDNHIYDVVYENDRETFRGQRY